MPRMEASHHANPLEPPPSNDHKTDDIPYEKDFSNQQIVGEEAAFLASPQFQALINQLVAVHIEELQAVRQDNARSSVANRRSNLQSVNTLKAELHSIFPSEEPDIASHSKGQGRQNNLEAGQDSIQTAVNGNRNEGNDAVPDRIAQAQAILKSSNTLDLSKMDEMLNEADDEDCDDEETPGAATRWGRLQAFLESDAFEMGVGAVLFFHVLLMGVQMQFEGVLTGIELGHYQDTLMSHMVDPTNVRDVKAALKATDHFFTAVFFADVSIRIAILGRRFFQSGMNWIDFLVVLASLVMMFFDDNGTNAVYLRLIRLGKLARAMRIVTFHQVLEPLDLILKCLRYSVVMLCWSFLLLGFLQCVAGMLVSSLARGFIEDTSQDEIKRQEVYMFYGTFTRTFLTMFEILFANWAPPCRALVENITEWFSVFFLFYRCFIGFSVLNVLNSVFVQSTMKIASMDEEVQYKQKQREQTRYTRRMKQLFQLMDTSGDGKISREEFEALLHIPKLKFWMSQLDLEYHDLLGLFELLDDGDGAISFDEFTEGVVRLKGQAKSIDVWRLETKMEVIMQKLLVITQKNANKSRVGSSVRLNGVLKEAGLKQMQSNRELY